MLVLSRRERQRIKLGDSIIVTVVRVSGDKVRLGIEAPAHVLVLRDELELAVADGPAVTNGPAVSNGPAVVIPAPAVAVGAAAEA
jgi:carbon storage regulator